jgi:UDP-N-acetylmuramoyl-tripeptide--D-alanyl-D-alanine ligase
MMEREFFTLREVAEIAGAAYFPDTRGDERLSQNFRADSRLIGPGDVFIAISGARDDGHNYIARAVENGAKCVILGSSYFEDHRDELSKLGAMFVAARDTTEAAVKIARAWLDAVGPKVAGITGSVGKTTTREFLYASLRGNFRTHSAVKSYNTLIGCGMTILAMPRGTEILILELGTNHPGEIRAIVENFPVTHGVITEVSAAHLEGLGNYGGVLDAKMEITGSRSLEYLSYNSDNETLSAAVSKMPNGEKMKKDGIRQIGVGYSNSGVRLSEVRQRVDAEFKPALSLSLQRREKKIVCNAPIFGRQHAKNIAFAYAAATQLSLDDDVFCETVRSFTIPAGRGVMSRAKNDSILLDETYNANPLSVSAALKNVLELETREDFRKIAILGGMRELGAESAHLHEVVMSRAGLFDEVYLIGNEWDASRQKGDSIKGLWPAVGDFIADFDFASLKHAAVLIKGSRYYGLEQLIPYIEEE